MGAVWIGTVGVCIWARGEGALLALTVLPLKVIKHKRRHILFLKGHSALVKVTVPLPIAGLGVVASDISERRLKAILKHGLPCSS